jgi:hypothetical protein
MDDASLNRNPTSLGMLSSSSSPPIAAFWMTYSLRRVSEATRSPHRPSHSRRRCIRRRRWPGESSVEDYLALSFSYRFSEFGRVLTRACSSELAMILDDRAGWWCR